MANQSVAQQTAPGKKGLFGKVEPSQDSEILGEIRNLSSRLRILEERYTNLKRKDLITEQNMLSNHKSMAAEIKAINSEIGEIKRDLSAASGKVKLLVNELGMFARKEEVKVLERYINMWDPLKFVTEEDVKKIVARMLGEAKKEP